jgi:hypothetical protein
MRPPIESSRSPTWVGWCAAFDVDAARIPPIDNQAALTVAGLR